MRTEGPPVRTARGHEYREWKAPVFFAALCGDRLRGPLFAPWRPGYCRPLAGPPVQTTPTGGAAVQQQGQDRSSQEFAEPWGLICEQLRASLGDRGFDHWFAELRPVSLRGVTLYITGPSQTMTWVERRYAEIVDFALEASATGIRELRFVAAGAADQHERTAAAGERSQGRGDATLNPSYTFERFVIGAGNRVAHGAALAVAEAPGQAYNPLFLHGPPGLGKTHLLGAIANYLTAHSPDLAVRYTTAESFTNEFVFALQSRGIEPFKQRYRRIDVLLIDDVQFLEGKVSTANEFFHTFNALYEAGAQIVLSADRLPGHLSALAERLRQRFQWGLAVELEPPDLPTRLIFVDRLLDDREPKVPPDAAETIARRAGSNLRLLQGAFTRVLALSSLTGAPVSVELIDRALPSTVPPPAPAQPSVDRIRELVAARLRIDPAALVTRTRAAPISHGRQLAMHLTRELTDLSLPAIATSFGRRDHTTVIHAIRQVRRRLDADPAFRTLVGELTEELSSAAIDRDRTD